MDLKSCKTIRLLAIMGLGWGCAFGQDEAMDPPPADELEAAAPIDADQPVLAEATAYDGPSYLISQFVPVYRFEHPDQPPLAEILDTTVTLGVTSDGYIEPRPGILTEDVNLAAMGGEPRRFYASAVGAVARAILAEFTERGLMAVVVRPHPDDIYLPDDPEDPNWGQDRRPEGDTTLEMQISIGTVSEVRTLGFGERLGTAEGGWINHEAHQRILKHSPVQPPEGEDRASRDLLNRKLLDRYVYRLNRHPGRRVDVAVTGGLEVGDVAVDYLVNENKPWTVYLQVSNTGTEQTSEWRERFGFIHNQLFNNDDILTLDYVTANFDEANAVIGSYEAPLAGDWLRWRVFGNWNEFTASDVGGTEDFTGEGYQAGGELIATAYQYNELFVDLFGGARWENTEVTNEGLGTTGESDFFIPFGGARLERYTETERTFASVQLEGNLPDLADTNTDDLELLGRLATDDEWLVLKYEASQSFFLEPLLMGASWEDPANHPTLAHEIYGAIRGQWVVDDARLVPTAEQVAGGFFTVRGYPESVVAGDDVVIANLEYRFHLPRALGVAEPGTLFGNQNTLLGDRFRWHPDQPYGQPDWDLILRGFLDVGRVVNNDKQTFEDDATLAGAGVGAELVFKRNLTLRADVGFALEDVQTPDNDVQSGDAEFHFAATLLF